MRRRLVDIALAGLAATLLLRLLASVPGLATPVTIPYTFTAGKTVPAAWLNGNYGVLANAVNHVQGDQIDDGTVDGLDLKTAPNGVPTSRLNDLAVTAAKLAIGATLNASTTANVQTSVSEVGGVERTLVTFGSVTTRGGRVVAMGNWALRTVTTASTFTLTLRFKRDGVTQSTISVQTTAGQEYLIPSPVFTEAPAAGTYAYTITAQFSAAGPGIVTPSVNAGSYLLGELS